MYKMMIRKQNLKLLLCHVEQIKSFFSLNFESTRFCLNF